MVQFGVIFAVQALKLWAMVEKFLDNFGQDT